MSYNEFYQSQIDESIVENGLTVNGDLNVSGNIIGEIVGAAGKLKTTGADITVSGSAQPDAGGGDVLVATDATNAVWGGAGYLKTGGFGSTLKIDVGNTYPPLAGQVLTAASSSFADWQTPLVSGTQIVDTFSLIRRDQGLPEGNTRGENSVDFQRDRLLSDQVAAGVNSVICGGSWNQNDCEQGFVGGGINNRITSTTFGNVIVGGLNSEIGPSAGQGNFIGSGNDNDITAGQYSVIAGGFDNLVNASNACIGGGNLNVCVDPNGFIGGGINNRLSGGNNSNAICAGQNNDITGGFYSFIGAGNNNNIARNRCVIAGGENNDIAGTADYASILGGQNNNINATFSTICGGKNHDITSGAGHFIGSGDDNNVNGGAYSCIVGGKTNTMSQSYSCIVGGRTSTVSHEGCFMFSPKPLAYASTAPNTAYFDVDKLQVEGKIQCSGAIVKGVYIVANLPTPSLGMSSYVSDSTQTLTAGIGTTVVGGGANFNPVHYDGTNWKIG
jgi:hypothetical protein